MLYFFKFSHVTFGINFNIKHAVSYAFPCIYDIFLRYYCLDTCYYLNVSLLQKKINVSLQLIIFVILYYSGEILVQNRVKANVMKLYLKEALPRLHQGKFFYNIYLHFICLQICITFPPSLSHLS